MRRVVEVVVGAQFGSEAKGHIVQRLTERAQANGEVPLVIRVAGPNAGHTGYDPAGEAWALRQVPVAAVTGKDALLYIAPGSEIDLEVLLGEADSLKAHGLIEYYNLFVSAEATMIEYKHKQDEDLNNLTGRLGSTAKGIGAARSERIWRRAKRLIDDEEALHELKGRGIKIVPAFGLMDQNPHTIIEGTQGFGLGLHSGFYPMCTSSDCRAIDFLAMAGINPWGKEVRVYAVARMFPIRVAGNSGPLKGETTWEELGLPQEHTTVTKKVRRVGAPDWDLVKAAVAANGGAPTVRVALTMLDQMYPGVRDLHLDNYALNDILRHYIRGVELKVQAKVDVVTTGPNTATFL